MPEIRYTKSDLSIILSHLGLSHKKSSKKTVLLELFTTIEPAELYKGLRTIDPQSLKWDPTQEHKIRGFYYPEHYGNRDNRSRLSREIYQVYRKFWGFISLLKQFRPEVSSWEGVELVAHVLGHTDSFTAFSESDPMYRLLQGQPLSDVFLPKTIEEMCDGVIDHKYFMEMFSPFVVRSDGNYVLDVKRKLHIKVSEEEERKSKLVSLLSSSNLADVNQGLILLEMLYNSIEELYSFFGMTFDNCLVNEEEFLKSVETDPTIAKYQYHWLQAKTYGQYPELFRDVKTLSVGARVPPEFELPDSMKTMDVFEEMSWSNRIIKLPSWIFTLANLRTLKLESAPTVAPDTIFSDSQITKVVICNSRVEQLPDWVWKLPNLKEIDAEKSQLEYFAPTQSSNVEILKLGFAKRYNSPSPVNSNNVSFVNLPKVSSISIKHLPEWTWSLPSLKHLSLQEGLRVFNPTQECTTLEIVSIRFCKYSHNLINFSKCTNLQELTMQLFPEDYSSIEGKYPFQGLENPFPESIRKLSLRIPRVDFYISNLNRLVNLETLKTFSIMNPSILGPLDNLKRLTAIHLHDVRDLSKNWLHNAQSVQILTIKGRNFTGPSLNLAKMTSLRHLEVADVDVMRLPSALGSLNTNGLSHQATLWNCVSEVEDLHSLTVSGDVCPVQALQLSNLINLNIRSQRVPVDMSALSKLEYLTLQYQDSKIPVGIENLKNLKVLNIQNDDKYELKRFPSEFLHLSSLEYLYFRMSYNVSDYPEDAFKILGIPYVHRGRVYWPRDISHHNIHWKNMRLRSLFYYGERIESVREITSIRLGRFIRVHVFGDSLSSYRALNSDQWKMFTKLAYIDLSTDSIDFSTNGIPPFNKDGMTKQRYSLPEFIQQIDSVREINLSFSRMELSEWVFEMPNLLTVFYFGSLYSESEKERFSSQAKEHGVTIIWTQ